MRSFSFSPFFILFSSLSFRSPQIIYSICHMNMVVKLYTLSNAHCVCVYVRAKTLLFVLLFCYFDSVLLCCWASANLSEWTSFIVYKFSGLVGLGIRSLYIHLTICHDKKIISYSLCDVLCDFKREREGERVIYIIIITVLFHGLFWPFIHFKLLIQPLRVCKMVR